MFGISQEPAAAGLAAGSRAPSSAGPPSSGRAGTGAATASGPQQSSQQPGKKQKQAGGKQQKKIRWSSLIDTEHVWFLENQGLTRRPPPRPGRLVHGAKLNVRYHVCPGTRRFQLEVATALMSFKEGTIPAGRDATRTGRI